MRGGGVTAGATTRSPSRAAAPGPRRIWKIPNLARLHHVESLENGMGMRQDRKSARPLDDLHGALFLPRERNSLDVNSSVDQAQRSVLPVR